MLPDGLCQHPRSCPRPLPHISYLPASRCLFREGQFWGHLNWSSSRDRPPQVASPRSHPLPSNLDSKAELTRGIAALLTFADISKMCPHAAPKSFSSPRGTEGGHTLALSTHQSSHGRLHSSKASTGE